MVHKMSEFNSGHTTKIVIRLPFAFDMLLQATFLKNGYYS